MCGDFLRVLRAFLRPGARKEPAKGKGKELCRAKESLSCALCLLLMSHVNDVMLTTFSAVATSLCLLPLGVGVVADERKLLV